MQLLCEYDIRMVGGYHQIEQIGQSAQRCLKDWGRAAAKWGKSKWLPSFPLWDKDKYKYNKDKDKYIKDKYKYRIWSHVFRERPEFCNPITSGFGPNSFRGTIMCIIYAK